MIRDMWTVMKKEGKELLLPRGGRGRSRPWNLVIVVAVFGVFLPLQFGRPWVESPVLLIAWAWVPLFVVTTVIADSFAGERERHTLETLLASRLSDRAILLGKVAAVVAYGWGLAIVSLVVGLITTNVAGGHGKLLLYSPLIALAVLILSGLGAGLGASAGVLVSLRAPTVRQAAQTMSIATMLLLFVPVFGGQALFQHLPLEWKESIARGLLSIRPAEAVVVGTFLLAVLDLSLLAVALTRFKRARLILD